MQLFLEDKIPVRTFSETVLIPENSISNPRIVGGSISGSSIAIGSGNTIFKADQNGIYLGNTDYASAPFSVNMSGTVVANDITLTGGTIKYGKTIFADTTNAGYYVSSDGFYFGSASDASYIKYNIGTAALDIKASITTTAGSSIGTSYLSGTIAQSNLNVSNRGWTQTCAFTSTDLDTVSWGAGTFTSADGTAYSISAGNTGNMSAKNYIYLDVAVSTTVYQTTTTQTTAVGVGKVLITIAQNAAVSATYALTETSQIVGDNILANTIDAGKINVSYLSAISANLGTVTAGSIYSGLFSTSTSGATTQRIILSQSTNALDFYDANNVNTISMGNYGANPLIEMALTSNVHTGISITGASDATSYGFVFENTSDRESYGLSIDLSSTGANNSLSAVSIKNSGSGELFYGEVNGSGRGLSIVRGSAKTGINELLRLYSDNNTAGAEVVGIYQQGVDVTSSCFTIESSTKGKVLDVSATRGTSNNPAGYFSHISVTAPTVQANKEAGGACLLATTVANDGYRCYGLEFNIANAGAGVEYAFHFQGDEYLTASAVTTVIGTIRVYTPDGSTGYVPVYQTRTA